MLQSLNESKLLNTKPDSVILLLHSGHLAFFRNTPLASAKITGHPDFRSKEAWLNNQDFHDKQGETPLRFRSLTPDTEPKYHSRPRRLPEAQDPRLFSKRSQLLELHHQQPLDQFFDPGRSRSETLPLVLEPWHVHDIGRPGRSEKSEIYSRSDPCRQTAIICIIRETVDILLRRPRPPRQARAGQLFVHALVSRSPLDALRPPFRRWRSQL